MLPPTFLQLGFEYILIKHMHKCEKKGRNFKYIITIKKKFVKKGIRMNPTLSTIKNIHIWGPIT